MWKAMISNVRSVSFVTTGHCDVGHRSVGAKPLHHAAHLPEADIEAIRAVANLNPAELDRIEVIELQLDLSLLRSVIPRRILFDSHDVV